MNLSAPIVLTALITISCATPPPPSTRRPNVVMIVVDTLRADRLGYHGCDVETSPALDRLAEESIRFLSAHSTAPWTLPSISTILTGQYPETLGIRGHESRLDDRFCSLAELFEREGYRTGAVVSHIYLRPKFGFEQGFGYFNAEEAGKVHGPATSPGVTRRGIEFVTAQGEEPFFLLLHYMDPHYDYRMHDVLNTFPHYRGQLKDGMTIRQMRELADSGTLEDDDKRYLRALYDSEIRFTDEHIGSFLAVLRDRGLWEDTLVVLTADHGEELCDRRDNWIGHTKKLTEELIHVPLLIKRPGGQAGLEISRPVSLVDLMPTVVREAGLGLPDGVRIDGVPMDLDHPEADSRDVFAATWRWSSMETVIADRWKYSADRREQRYCLFDLAADPGETVNLYSSETEIVEQLDRRLRDWSSRCSASQVNGLRADHVPDLSQEERTQLEALGYVQ